MGRLALALLVALVSACASAPEAVGPPAARTEVFVLGMIHGGHLTSERWGVGELRATIRRIDPDVVCAEIPPDRWEATRRTWLERGVVEDDRVQRFPEYTEVLFPLMTELGFEVEPCAAWTRAMADERRLRIEEFETDPAHEVEAAAYAAETAEVTARLAADPLDDGDPYVIHSPEYDARTKAELGPYERHLNEFIGAGGWTNINRAHWALIDAALDRHAGRRVLITFGAGHKYWFLEQLRLRADVELVDVKPYLPPRE